MLKPSHRKSDADSMLDALRMSHMSLSLDMAALLVEVRQITAALVRIETRMGGAPDPQPNPQQVPA